MTSPAIRRNIWPVLLLASASVSAQLAPAPTWMEMVSGENISFSEATWELFSRVASSNGADLLPEVSVMLQLDGNQTRALSARTKEAVKESEAHSTSLRKTMCAKRAEFTTIDGLARELDRIDDEVLNQRDKLMVGIAPLLGYMGAAKLEPLVLGVRNGMTLPRINYAEAMRVRKESPAAVLTRMCAEFK